MSDKTYKVLFWVGVGLAILFITWVIYIFASGSMSFSTSLFTTGTSTTQNTTQDLTDPENLEF